MGATHAMTGRTAVTLALLLSASALIVPSTRTAAAGARAPLPVLPVPVEDIVFARPFVLAEGFEYRYRAERPTVTEGWILVIEADPALLRPRQAAEPMLYVGDTLVWFPRRQDAFPTGRAVVLVPSRVDLERSEIWFGTPELPERVTAAVIRAERRKAIDSGIAPLPAGRVRAVVEAGGDLLRLDGSPGLEAAARGLFDVHVRPLIPAPAPPEQAP